MPASSHRGILKKPKGEFPRGRLSWLVGIHAPGPDRVTVGRVSKVPKVPTFKATETLVHPVGPERNERPKCPLEKLVDQNPHLRIEHGRLVYAQPSPPLSWTTPYTDNLGPAPEKPVYFKVRGVKSKWARFL